MLKSIIRSFHVSSPKKLGFNQLNKVQIIGNVGTQPTVQEMGDKKVANFRLASHEFLRNAKGEVEKVTQWHRISVVNNTLVEFCQKNVHKGTRVYVEGKILNKEVEKGNIKYTITNIVLGQKGDLVVLSGSQTQQQQPQTDTEEQETIQQKQQQNE